MEEHKQPYIPRCGCAKCKETIRIKNAKRNPKRRHHRLPFDPIIALMSTEQRNDNAYSVKNQAGKTISVFAADRWCVKLGYHPWTVYGDLWFQDLWENNEQAKSKRN